MNDRNPSHRKVTIVTSLQTLNRLLDAAERILEEEGLDAATVPNRASTAAVTALMLMHRDKIGHPHPEAAIEFAVLIH